MLIEFDVYYNGINTYKMTLDTANIIAVNEVVTQQGGATTVDPNTCYIRLSGNGGTIYRIMSSYQETRQKMFDAQNMKYKLT